MPKPSHIADDGSIFMVDVSGKAADRANRSGASARASGRRCRGAALRDATLAKGDAFAAAQIAGIMAAKQTAALIPLAHAIPLAAVDVTFSWDGDVLVIDTQARDGRANRRRDGSDGCGGVSALDDLRHGEGRLRKASSIESVRLLEKTGGKSGDVACRLNVALIVLSDRAASGTRADGCLAGHARASRARRTRSFAKRVLPDDAGALQAELIDLCDSGARLTRS